MKRSNIGILASMALVLAAPPLLAERGSGRTRVVTRGADGSVRVEHKLTAEAYSAQLNIVTRIQGTSFFKTAVDITNNTDVNGVIAQIQYCYTFAGSFACTPQEDIELLSFDNFHTDDIVGYIDSLGVLPAGAGDQSFGTLLVTFQNVPSRNGWEGTVTGRTYSPYSQANPALGTVAIAYLGSLFFESANDTLVATIRDTRAAPTEAGALRTNLGITNTDINLTGNVNVDISFYDTETGNQVGNVIHVDNLQPGEVRQFNNIWAFAAIPANVQSVIAFSDVRSNSPALASVEGYVNIADGGTQDGAYFEMKCADLGLCGD